MTPSLHALLQAAEKLTTRLRMLQKMQLQARERGEAVIELHVEELFDSGDAEALAAWEAARDLATGQVPLPLEPLSLSRGA